MIELQTNETDLDLKVETDSEQEDGIEMAFESIYESLKELDSKCSEFTRQFQDYRKVLEAQSLEEQEFFPKKEAMHWFKRNGVKTPCRIADFLEAFLSEESKKDRICSEERTVKLGKQARKLFQTEKEIVSWMELLALVPKVFE